MKKNWKRFFAGLVTSAMIMSTAVLPAYSAPETTTDTIDITKPVSLTIHKFDYTVQTGDTPIEGTGSSNDNVPAGATGLNDVTFTVYKIADIEQGTDNGSVGIKYKALTDIAGQGTVPEYIDGGMTAESIKAMFITNTTVNSILNARTAGDNKVSKVTANVGGEDGIAEFQNADLDGQGLYLVVETDKPDKVTSTIDPFLVSLPTTIQQTTDSGWLYDVHAFPKNSTQTSSITIKKIGKASNETETEDIAGATFYIQKKEGTNWVTLTKDANGGDIGTAGLITVPAAGITISNLAPGSYRLVEASAPPEYIAESNKVYLFDIDSNGKVTVGGSDTSTITVTNDKPEVEKEVLKKGEDGAEDSDWSDQVDYSVGDTVKFKITTSVPTCIAELKTFKLIDTFDAGIFDIDDTSFTYKFYTGEGNTKTEKTMTLTSTPVVTQDAGKDTGWVLDLTPDKAALEANAVTTIEVMFDAVLTSDAITAGEGNVNTIGLEFSNKVYPDTDTDPDNPVTPPTGVTDETTTITDEVVVYTFGIQLNKTFAGSTPGDNFTATFDLYVEDVNGTDTIKVGGADVKVTKVGTYTTDADGKIILNTSGTGGNDTAFSNGTYYFVETSTADGYNMLKEPVKVEVEIYYTKTFKTITTTTQYDADGNVVGTPIITESGEETTTYYSDAGKLTEITGDDLITSIDVENRKGFNFPVTGGKGTIIFTVAGLALMIAAVLVFFGAKKRKSN